MNNHKTGKMTKQTRSLIILGAVLVVLVAFWLGSIWIPGLSPAQETLITTALSEKILYSAQPQDIAQIIVRSNQGELILSPVQANAAEGNTAISWGIAGETNWPISSAAVKAIVDAALNVTYTTEIATDASDLGVYGLTDPLYSLTAVGTDGVSHTIGLGYELSSGSGVYARLDQSRQIVAVDTNYKTLAAKTMADLIDTTQIAGGLQIAQLTGLEFQRLSDQLHMVTTCQPNNPEDATAGMSFELTKPVTRSGNAETLMTLAESVLNLPVAGVVDLRPDVLSHYGLDKPAYQFILQSTTSGPVSVSIGKRAGDDLYYATSSALPVIVTIYASKLTAVDLSLEDYVDRMIALESIWTVSAVEINIGEQAYHVTIDMDEEQKTTDETVQFTMNGQDAKILSQTGSSLFNTFYQRLISIRLAGFDLEAEPENTAESRIVYHLEADSASGEPEMVKTIEFSRRDAYTDYVFVNGRYSGFYVNHQETFTEDRPGQEGILVACQQMQDAIDRAIDGVFNTEKGYQLNE